MWDCETSASVGLEKVVRAKSRLGSSSAGCFLFVQILRDETTIFRVLLSFTPLALYERTLNSSNLTGAGYPYIDLQLNFDMSSAPWCSAPRPIHRIVHSGGATIVKVMHRLGLIIMPFNAKSKLRLGPAEDVTYLSSEI